MNILNSQIDIIGVYPITPNHDSIIRAINYHEYTWLLNEDHQLKKKINFENYHGLSLIEILVQGSLATSIVESISQQNQAPYLEFYFDPSGMFILEEDQLEKCSNFRLCFFIHFVDVNSPININNQSYVLPSISDLPSRLKPYVHYVPIDM